LTSDLGEVIFSDEADPHSSMPTSSSSRPVKPWKDSTDYEKLDGDNGLLLAPHVDHLFDRGFVSFTRQGKVLVSAKLDSSILTSWQVDPSKNVGDFSSEQDQYLDYHIKRIA
jgi:hypothetical protein